MKTRGEKLIADDFELSAKTMAWMEQKYPQVDIGETLERFQDWARQKGVMYADWQAGFKTVVRKAIDNGWRSIVTLKGGKAFDPKWQPLLHEARKHGFREPKEMEPVGTYRTALDLWKRRGNKVVQFEDRKVQLDMTNQFQARWGSKGGLL